MFRSAFKERRCIIPASGFYEWTGEKGAKQPHLFTAAEVRPSLPLPAFGTAGAIPRAAREVLSCTIIVSGASEWMKTYHDRMPMILDSKSSTAGLTVRSGPEALKCASEIALRQGLVSKRLNRTGAGDDDPTIIEPLSAAAAS